MLWDLRREPSAQEKPGLNFAKKSILMDLKSFLTYKWTEVISFLNGRNKSNLS